MLPRISFMAYIGEETGLERSDIHSNDDYLTASEEEEKLAATKVRSSHEFIIPSRDARDLSPSPRHEGWNYERRCTGMHKRETKIDKVRSCSTRKRGKSENVMEYPAGRKRSVSQVTPRSKLNFATTYTTELRLEHAKNREPLPSAVFRSRTQRFLYHASQSYTPTGWKSVENLTTHYESIQRKGITPSYLKRPPKVVANNLLWEQRIESVCSKKHALPWLVHAKEGRSIEKQIDMSPSISSEQQHFSTSSAAELCTEYIENHETLLCCGIRSTIDLLCYSEEPEVDQRVTSTKLMPEIIVPKSSDLNGPPPAEASTSTAQYVEHLRDYQMVPHSEVRSTTNKLTHYREKPTMTLSKTSAGSNPPCSFYQKYLDEIAGIERKYPFLTANWDSSHTTLKEGVQSSESEQPVEQEVDLFEEGSNSCSEKSYMTEVEYAAPEVPSVNEFEETSIGQVTIIESKDGFSPICDKSPILSEDEDESKKSGKEDSLVHKSSSLISNFTMSSLFSDDENESIRSGKENILEQKSSSIISDYSISPLFSHNEEELRRSGKEDICQSRLSDKEEKPPLDEPKGEVKPPTAEELEEIWRIILYPKTIKSEQQNAHSITSKRTNLDEVEPQNAHPITLKRMTNLDKVETYKAMKKWDDLKKRVDEIDDKIQYILWKDFKVEPKNKRMDINKVARQVKQLTSDPRRHQHPLLSTPSTSRGKKSSLNPAPYLTGSDQTRRKEIKSYSGRIDFTLSDDYRRSYEIYARATSSRGPGSSYPAPYPTGSDQMRRNEIKPSPARFDFALIDGSRRSYGIYSNSRDDILGQAILEEKMNKLKYLQSIGRIPSMREE